MFHAVYGTFFGVKVVFASNWSSNAKVIDGILYRIRKYDFLDVAYRTRTIHSNFNIKGSDLKVRE
jgi:hypothetical protein